MANVEPIAATIDFEVLLTPIAGDNPAGEELKYSGLYDQIREARRSDDASLAQGEWQTELKTADFRKVVDLATPALTTRAKDLQIAVWLTEALAATHGFAGFRDGIQLCYSFAEQFWENLYPVEETDDVDENGNPKFIPDGEARANAVDWLNNELVFVLKKIPITAGNGFSFNDWEESVRFDIPDNLDALAYEEQERFKKLKEQAEKENRKTSDGWRKAIAATNRAFCETLNLTLDECFTALNELDRVNEEKFDRNQVPSVNDLKKNLSSIISAFKPVLDQKRLEEPDESDVEEETEVSEDGAVVVKGPAVATGAIQNRADALKRLADVADYFRKTEPNSPIPALLIRAVKWGNMPFDALVQDMIKDEQAIYQIRQTLGFNTSAESSEGS